MANVQDRGPPSTAAVAIGTAIISVLVGYYIGQARSIGLFGASSTSHPSARVGRQQVDDEEDDSDASDAESQDGDALVVGELKRFADNSEECKLVLVTRTDLGMTKGKSGRCFPLPLHPTATCSLAHTYKSLSPHTPSDDPATPLAHIL